MALTGTLLADFSAFTNEAAKATTAVKTMETGADTAAAKLSKIGEGVNVKSTISDPLGTATTVATQFGESLGAVGVAAVGLTAGVVALGAAIWELGVKSAGTIAEFDDLADKTGMSVPALSRLSDAAAVVGADMGTLTNVVFKLQQGIGENSAAFQKGLAAMGLSTETLKAEGPDRYLETVAAGLKAIEDPSARAAAGTAVLGKGYRDVAAALNDLATGYEKTANIEPFTAQQAADAEAFLFQINALKVQIAALGVSIGSELIPPLSMFVGWIEKLKGAYDALPDGVRVLLTPVNLAKAAFGEASAAIDVFTGKVSDLPTVTGNAAQGTAAWRDSVKDLAIYVPTATDALAAEKEVIKDLDPITRQLAASTAELVAASQGWQTTVDTLSGSVVEAIKYYLSAGVSQAELAKAYGLTAAQVKAVAIALDEYATALNATADLEKAEADRRKEITAIDLKATNDRVLAEFQKQQAAEASEAAFLKANLADAQAQDAIQQGVTTTTKAAVESADVIGNAYQQHFKAAQGSFEQFQGVVMAGTAAMAQGMTDATATWETAQGRYDEFMDAQVKSGGTRSIVGMYGGLPTVQTRDSGGPVVAGQSYLIGGGKAPELFTPGASGFVTPGGGGGGSVVQNIYVTQPLGTPEAIARAVADAQVGLMRGQGVRLPYGT